MDDQQQLRVEVLTDPEHREHTLMTLQEFQAWCFHDAPPGQHAMSPSEVLAVFSSLAAHNLALLPHWQALQSQPILVDDTPPQTDEHAPFTDALPPVENTVAYDLAAAPLDTISFAETQVVPAEDTVAYGAAAAPLSTTGLENSEEADPIEDSPMPDGPDVPDSPRTDYEEQYGPFQACTPTMPDSVAEALERMAEIDAAEDTPVADAQEPPRSQTLPAELIVSRPMDSFPFWVMDSHDVQLPVESTAK